MKKLFMIILAVTFLVSGLNGFCQSQEKIILEGEFKAKTSNNEVEKTKDVIINQTYPKTITWSLGEIDSYIVYYESQIKSYKEYIETTKEYIKDMKILRKKVEEQAKKVKVKLKVKGEKL